MKFYKLICTHERPLKLRNSLEAYAKAWREGRIRSPDVCLVVDSSINPDKFLMESNSIPFVKYIHAPGSDISNKQQLFIKNLNPTDLDFIDLSSDEDLYLREPPRVNCPFIVQIERSFSWLFFQGPQKLKQYDFIYLRDSSSFIGNLLAPPVILTESERYIASCKYSYPDMYWSLMSGDMFLLRFALVKFLRANLPINSVKIDEIFLNILMPFASLVPDHTCLRLRNCDDSQSLRSTVSSESYARSSFVSIYKNLESNYSLELIKCIEYTTSLVNHILAAKKSNIRINSSQLQQLMKASIASYSKTLSYDLNNNSYVFRADCFSYNDSFNSINVSRIDLTTFRANTFRSSRLTSLLFQNGLNHKFFAALDPSSCLTDQNLCNLLTSVPLTYWNGIRSSFEDAMQ